MLQSYTCLRTQERTGVYYYLLERYRQHLETAHVCPFPCSLSEFQSLLLVGPNQKTAGKSLANGTLLPVHPVGWLGGLLKSMWLLLVSLGQVVFS